MTDGIATFSFDSPGSICVDWGGARRIGETLSGWFSQRNLLIVTDRFLHESGALDPLWPRSRPMASRSQSSIRSSRIHRKPY